MTIESVDLGDGEVYRRLLVDAKELEQITFKNINLPISSSEVEHLELRRISMSDVSDIQILNRNTLRTVEYLEVRNEDICIFRRGFANAIAPKLVEMAITYSANDEWKMDHECSLFFATYGPWTYSIQTSNS